MHLKLRCSILFGKTPTADRFVKIRTLIIETEKLYSGHGNNFLIRLHNFFNSYVFVQILVGLKKKKKKCLNNIYFLFPDPSHTLALLFCFVFSFFCYTVLYSRQLNDRVIDFKNKIIMF